MQAVGIYCRISKDDGSAEGVKTQERKARRYAVDHWPDMPIRVFVDNDLTAADPDTRRPAYEDLLDAIRRGQIAHVVCAEQSRLTRQPAEWEDLVVTLVRADIGEIHTYRSGRIDVAGSKLVGRILSAVDAEEVERLKLRINERLDSLAAEGRPPGGRSFGYRHDTDDAGRKTLVVIPAEAEVARDAAVRLLAGWSLTNIARDLEARHVPTARGGRWTTQTVRSMLTSPTITAKRVHRGEIVGAGAWQPILDEATWRKVRDLLRQPVMVTDPRGRPIEVTRRRRKPRRYLLTGGIAVCGRCGADLIAQVRTGRSPGSRPGYFCHRTHGGCNGIGILADPLEEHVAAVLLDELDRPEFWAAFASDGHETERARLNAELEDIEAQRSELGRMWAAREIDAAGWKAALATLDQRAVELAVAIDSLPAPAVDVDPAFIRDGWELMTLDERRQIAAMFIARVTIGPAKPGTRRFDPDRVTIEWRTA